MLPMQRTNFGRDMLPDPPVGPLRCTADKYRQQADQVVELGFRKGLFVIQPTVVRVFFVSRVLGEFKLT